MSQLYGVFTLLIFLCSTGISAAQTIEIGGTVENQQGFPLPGASIAVKGTHQGTVSRGEGQFKLTVKKNAVLSISILGYQPKEVKVTQATSGLVIKLDKTTNALNELVVTALNISKEKKSLGYSVQALDSKDINEAKEPNLVNALSGKIAGVRVTNSQGGMGSSRIIIRGETSISGNNQPLFVIDGVPVDNSQFSGIMGSGTEATRDFTNAIADINPADIASISVLKGPNAAALYGSRAANGVILIQTKDGSKVNGLGVTLNSNTTVSTPLVLPTYQNVFGQGSQGKFKYVDGKGGGINDGVDESWGPPMDGRLIPQFYSNGEPVPFVPHPDNVKKFFKTGYKFNNGISVAGSGDNYNFRFSYNNMSQRGILPNTSQQRNSFSVHAGYTILPNLSLDVMANYIRRDAPNLPGGSHYRSSSPLLQFTWFGRQVSMDKLYEFYKAGKSINWNNLYYSNPYFVSYNNTASQTRNRLLGSVNLKYDVTEELQFSFRTGNDRYTDKRKMKVAYGTKGTPYGSYQEEVYIVDENNTSARFNYTHDLNQNINLDVMGGGNIRTNTLENNNQMAPKLAIAGVYTLNNSRVPLISSNYYSKLKTYSLFGSAQIGFKRYVYLNLTARNDWSSSLPIESQSYFYPSVNGSFILSEALDITSKQVNFIKLRGGWSQVGKATSAYQLINTYNFSTPFKGNPQLNAATTNLNPNLKPEETRSVEAGVEGRFFDNRVHLDVSLYNMNSYNQILAVDVSPSTGYEKELINGGKINNKGIEVQLNVQPLRTETFTWDMMINYSSNHSKVVRVDKAGKKKSYVLGSEGTVQVLAAIDKPYGMLFGTAYERNDKGQIIIDASGRPVVSPDKKYLGQYTPDWLGSINNSFSWKSFHLSFLVDAHVGGSLFSVTNRYGQFTGVLASTLPGRDAAHGGLLYYYPGNDNSKQAVALPAGSNSAPGGATVHEDGIIAKGVFSNGKKNDIIIAAQDYYKTIRNVDEEYVYDASYVKLREVKLGYQLPFNFIKRIGLQHASVALVGRNLWIISKHTPNIDPENAFNTGNAQGLEHFAIPSVRSIGVNINLKF